MNKACVFYEQESGDLDEDELYRVHLNPHIFIEELPAPSALLEVVIMLDLSGSMTDENKLELQLVLSVALALAFEANPDISRGNVCQCRWIRYPLCYAEIPDYHTE